MAVLSTTHPTLADVAKRLDPNGKVDTIVELLNETNEILEDCVFIEGNLPTGHRTSIRSGLPEPTWRRLYQGVQPTKSRSVQVTENTGMLEAYAEVDKALADLNGNTAAFRLSEDRAHIEGMNQEFAETLLYGSEGNEPEAFTGFAPRYNDLSSAENRYNIVDAGGTTSSNYSIWLVVWGPDTVHCIYPKGSRAGLQMNDKGEVTIEDVDGNGGRMEAYRTHYRWDSGVAVRDWRYVSRVANIDAATILGHTSGAVDAQKALVRYLIQAAERIPALGRGRAAFYMSRSLREALRLGIVEKTVSQLTYDTVGGKRVMAFDDIPVRRVDSLHGNEARVV